jgi:hypothetical protein
MLAPCSIFFIISQLTVSASLIPSTSSMALPGCQGVGTQDGSSHSQAPAAPPVAAPFAGGGNANNVSEGQVEATLLQAYQVQFLNVSRELEQINVGILSLKGMESKLDYICDAQKNISHMIEDVNSSVVRTISSTTFSPSDCKRHLESLQSAMVHGFHGASKRFRHVNDLVERGLLHASLQRTDQVDGNSSLARAGGVGPKCTCNNAFPMVRGRNHSTTSINMQSPLLINLHGLLRTAGTGLTMTGLTISAVATLQVIEQDCHHTLNIQITHAVSEHQA